MLQHTYIDPEELAYNTPTGAHSNSNRHGKVMCSDGKIRTVTLGVPDTYFSIPAHMRWDGMYVSGYVTCDDNNMYWFHQSNKEPK